MTAKCVSAPFWELRDQPSDQYLPFLSDPVWRSSLGLKVALVLLHVVFVGAVFILDDMKWLEGRSRKGGEKRQGMKLNWEQKHRQLKWDSREQPAISSQHKEATINNNK